MHILKYLFYLDYKTQPCTNNQTLFKYFIRNYIYSLLMKIHLETKKSAHSQINSFFPIIFNRQIINIIFCFVYTEYEQRNNHLSSEINGMSIYSIWFCSKIVLVFEQVFWMNTSVVYSSRVSIKHLTYIIVEYIIIIMRSYIRVH